MQLSLLDQFLPQADVAFGNNRRHDLSRGAWVDYVPEWCRGHQALLQLLIATADWELHKRRMYGREVEVPRLVAGLVGSGSPLGFADGSVTYLRSRAKPKERERARGILLELSQLLSERYGRKLNQITLGYYRDGRDSVAYHGDKLGALRADTLVAIVSVGARRKFLLRPSAASPAASAPRPAGVKSQSDHGCCFQPGEGDLLVMGGTCQETWEHAVPKVQHSGRGGARPRLPGDGSGARGRRGFPSVGCGARIAIMFREPPRTRKLLARRSAGWGAVANY